MRSYECGRNLTKTPYYYSPWFEYFDFGQKEYYRKATHAHTTNYMCLLTNTTLQLPITTLTCMPHSAIPYTNHAVCTHTHTHTHTHIPSHPPPPTLSRSSRHGAHADVRCPQRLIPPLCGDRGLLQRHGNQRSRPPPPRLPGGLAVSPAHSGRPPPLRPSGQQCSLVIFSNLFVFPCNLQ